MIRIAHRDIGPSHPPFVIAEMSGNHNQSLDRALEIVDAAAKSGAHALKIQTYTPDTMTLDHVTPRKGLTAYDRRDNLVLCCKRCNSAKADKPFVAYLLAQRGRAANLLRYGAHLSHGILDLVRHLAGDAALEAGVTGTIAPRIVYGPDDDNDDSPYLDSPYRETA